MDYVLDTSAIKKLGREELRAAASRAKILVSPVSVYELLSHLEDQPRRGESEKETFARNRGSALLCQRLSMLDDPFAEVGVRAGAGDQVAMSHYMEKPVLERALQALKVSRDLEDFYRREVPLEDGSTGTLRDLGSGLKGALTKLENEYVSRVGQYNSLLKSRFSFDQIRDLSGPPLYHIVDQGTAIMASKLGLSTAGSGNALSRVRFAIFPHLGYLVARSIEYSVNAGRIGQPQVNRNDAEDSQIACHLAVDVDRTLVSHDKGFHATLAAAFDAFLQVTGVEVHCRVRGVDEFAREIRL